MKAFRATLDRIQSVLLSPRIMLGLLGFATVLMVSQFLLRVPRAFVKPTAIMDQTRLVEREIEKLKKEGVPPPSGEWVIQVKTFEEEILPELEQFIVALHDDQADFKTVKEIKDGLSNLLGGEGYIVDALSYSIDHVADFSGEVDLVENQGIKSFVGEFDGAYDFLPFYIQTDYLVKDRTSKDTYTQRRSWLFSYWPKEDLVQLVGQSGGDLDAG